MGVEGFLFRLLVHVISSRVYPLFSCCVILYRTIKAVLYIFQNNIELDLRGVSQDSIDTPLLFNLFIYDLVFFIQYCTLSSYADDNNLFFMIKNKDQVKTSLSSDFKIINERFYENFMILNPGKSHFMCIGKEIDDAESLNFNDLAIKNRK